MEFGGPFPLRGPAAFSPDGLLLASTETPPRPPRRPATPGGGPPPLPPSRLTLRGTHSLALHYTLLLDAPPSALAFSPASDALLVVSPAGGRADVLDVAAGEWAASLEGGDRGVSAAAWSGCGAYVVLVPADGLSVCVWGVASGVRVAELGRVKLVAPPPVVLPLAGGGAGGGGGRPARVAAGLARNGGSRGRLNGGGGGGVGGGRGAAAALKALGAPPPAAAAGRPPPPPPPVPLLAYSPVAPLAAIVARSPTGDRLCLYATDAAVALTDVSDGAAAGVVSGWAPIGAWPISPADTAGIAWAPDGHSVVVWDSPLAYHVTLYSLTGTRLWGVDVDGSTAAVTDGVFGGERRPPPSPAAFAGGLGVSDVAWSPSGRLLAVASYDLAVRVLRSDSGAVVALADHAALGVATMSAALHQHIRPNVYREHRRPRPVRRVTAAAPAGGRRGRRPPPPAAPPVTDMTPGVPRPCRRVHVPVSPSVRRVRGAPGGDGAAAAAAGAPPGEDVYFELLDDAASVAAAVAAERPPVGTAASWSARTTAALAASTGGHTNGGGSRRHAGGFSRPGDRGSGRGAPASVGGGAGGRVRGGADLPPSPPRLHGLSWSPCEKYLLVLSAARPQLVYIWEPAALRLNAAFLLVDAARAAAWTVGGVGATASTTDERGDGGSDSIRRAGEGGRGADDVSDGGYTPEQVTPATTAAVDAARRVASPPASLTGSKAGSALAAAASAAAAAAGGGGSTSRLAIVSAGECAYLWDERGAVVVRTPSEEEEEDVGGGAGGFAASGVAWSATGALRLDDRRQSHSMLVAFADEGGW